MSGQGGKCCAPGPIMQPIMRGLIAPEVPATALLETTSGDPLLETTTSDYLTEAA